MTAYHVSLPLDHVGWLVGDLSAASNAFNRLGFRVTAPGTLKTGGDAGTLQDLGQRSAHVMFADTYVELTAVAAAMPPTHLARYMARPGLVILALRVPDVAAAHRALAATAVSVTAVAHSERPVDYGPAGRQGTARFHWFMCVAEDFPELLVCFVQHLTPELVFQPAVAAHDYQVVALSHVLLFTSDIAQTRARYQRLAAAVALDETPAGLILLDGPGVARRFPGLAPGATTRALGIGLAVTDLTAVERNLSAAGSAGVRDGERIWCPGPEGTVLEFFQRTPPGRPEHAATE